MTSGVFTKQYLQSALRKAHLPFGYKTLLRYERAGIIPCSTSSIPMRLYTQEEIDSIVVCIRHYKGGYARD